MTALASSTRLLRITIEQYDRMIRSGALREGEPYELLDGQIVAKDRAKTGEDSTIIGLEHAWAVENLRKLDTKLLRRGCWLRIQQPVAVGLHSAPEPDGVVVRGGNDDYRDRRPGPRDILCLIEVADSSLEFDRTVKLSIYANGGIALYLILNLPERVVEVYSQPLLGKGRFAQVQTLTLREMLEIPVPRGASLRVPVKALLPLRHS